MSAAALTAAFAAHKAGRLDEAIAGYRAVLAAEPDDVDALALLASALRTRGHADEAVPLFERAIELAPQRADLGYNFGNALSALGRKREAVAVFRASLALDPARAEVHANLAQALAALGDFDEAEAAYGAALAVDPDHRMAAVNLANLIGERGRTTEALERFEAVVARHPDLAEARYDRALVKLRAGDWTSGFADYEARWATPGFSSPVRHGEIADWDGRPGPGRLLVHAEQGLGDTIQFVRLLPLAASLGWRITLEAPSVMLRLLSTLERVEAVTDAVADPASFSAQTPLLGLPKRLGLTPGAIPRAAPRLFVDPERVARFGAALGLGRGEETVAVVWRGNPSSPADRGRSLPSAAALAPFAAKGRRLLALQKVERSELVAHDGPTGWRIAEAEGFVVEHPGPEFDGGRDAFLDSAAVLSLVDRVVSVDTAFGHLAGTLGKPTALLLKAVADWRWFEERSDTPWYPATRLIRQERAGDWGEPIRAAAEWLGGPASTSGGKDEKARADRSTRAGRPLREGPSRKARDGRRIT